MDTNKPEDDRELKAVVGFCVSPKVDREAANNAKIPILTAREANNNAVAEYAVLMALAMSRNIVDHTNNMSNGVWAKYNGSPRVNPWCRRPIGSPCS